MLLKSQLSRHYSKRQAQQYAYIGTNRLYLVYYINIENRQSEQNRIVLLIYEKLLVKQYMINDQTQINRLAFLSLL